MKKSKDTIVFDLMGVLFQEGLYVTKLLYPRIKNRIEYTELKKRYTLFAVGNIPSEEFWRGLFDDQNRMKRFEKTFLNSLPLTENCVEILKKLHKTHHLILFSEVPAEWGDYLLRRTRIQNYFHTILFSGRSGYTKPYKRYFDVLDSRVPHNTRKSYIIDDSMENLEEAKKRGYITIWLNPSAIKKTQSIDYKIDKLEKILTRIG